MSEGQKEKTGAESGMEDLQSQPQEQQRLRVRVCTWNVGGVVPGQTDLGPLIFGENVTNADIFVFSFQEISTLDSAVNNFLASLSAGRSLARVPSGGDETWD